VNVTLFTYFGTCCVGFTIDIAAVPDYDVLIGCFREGFEEVLDLAGEHHPLGLAYSSNDAPEPILLDVTNWGRLSFRWGWSGRCLGTVLSLHSWRLSQGTYCRLFSAPGEAERRGECAFWP